MTQATGAGDTKDTKTQTDGDVGDLETAGETTAAEMIGGKPDTRPVGTGTIADIKISGEDE
jgi:hypothetical protein